MVFARFARRNGNGGDVVGDDEVGDGVEPGVDDDGGSRNAATIASQNMGGYASLRLSLDRPTTHLPFLLVPQAASLPCCWEPVAGLARRMMCIRSVFEGSVTGFGISCPKRPSHVVTR